MTASPETPRRGSRSAVARILCPIVRNAGVCLGAGTIALAVSAAAGHAGQKLYDMGPMFNQPHPFESVPDARASAPSLPVGQPPGQAVDVRLLYGRETTLTGFETMVERRDALGSPKGFEDAELAAAPPNIRLAISGHVNRALLVVDDGSDDGTDNDKNFFNVDSDNSATRLRFLAHAQLDENRAIGSNIVLQFQSNATSDISQADTSSTEDFVGTRNLEVWFSHSEYGEVWMGKGHTASDDTTERDLSGTGVAAYSGVADMAAGIEFRVPQGRLSGIAISDIFNNLDGLGRDNRLRYDTPRYRGANLAVSLVDGGNWDVALLYGQKFPKNDLAVVGAAYYADADATDGFTAAGGSFSILEETSGLNLTTALGVRDQGSGNDRTFIYVKFGWKADFFRFGGSDMSLDVFATQDARVDDDEGLSVGYFIVQKIRATGTDLYGGIRWYSYESAIDLQDILAGTIGVRQKF